MKKNKKNELGFFRHKYNNFGMLQNTVFYNTGITIFKINIPELKSIHIKLNSTFFLSFKFYPKYQLVFKAFSRDPKLTPLWVPFGLIRHFFVAKACLQLYRTKLTI
jgi:hypothetical protein